MFKLAIRAYTGFIHSQSETTLITQNHPLTLHRQYNICAIFRVNIFDDFLKNLIPPPKKPLYYVNLRDSEGLHLRGWHRIAGL